jgi:hypothetical protein
MVDDLTQGPTPGVPIPEGSTIFCLGCGSGLYQTSREVRVDDIRESSLFMPLTEHPLSAYPFSCPVCSRLVIDSSGRFRYRPPNLFSL